LAESAFFHALDPAMHDIQELNAEAKRPKDDIINRIKQSSPHAAGRPERKRKSGDMPRPESAKRRKLEHAERSQNQMVCYSFFT
jgi:hypothetical protein